MNDIFKKLFYAGVSLEDLSLKFGYDEDTLLGLLEGKYEMTKEEKDLLKEFLNE